jgi:hypothetical protein
MVSILITACSQRHRYIPKVKYPYPTHSALKKTLHSKYGDRYVYAGQGPNCFDCSGLIYYTYATMNLWLPRRAVDQSKVGKRVSINELKHGDLIFFDTHRYFRGRVNHAGIYIGNGYFIHASSAKRRVTTSSLRKPFYRRRVVVCRRVMHLKGKKYRWTKHYRSKHSRGQKRGEDKRTPHHQTRPTISREIIQNQNNYQTRPTISREVERAISSDSSQELF